MRCGKAEDAGGLTPAKDDSTALRHFSVEYYRLSCGLIYTRIPYFPLVEKPNFPLEYVEDFWQKYPVYSAYCTNFPKIERLCFSFL